ncbi:uncharacterized protein SCODWIG_00920 [Saccharomycodes ludwigii]|uniref:Autophagy-related protein 33 n=1 Tax=Saccharomycodes ludwigii TaxID=36035 RepID=A0A376B3J3_9ASCO|nr:hypothetical protein SCDLUD_000828 [Saccharomycodes ludwigii]KAH3903209.1 hypothetical protein SCDLUD_000828 [Saccharomycodes ludwigii]SSD59159.1 uncharacterized protein SCODWIG_00920 [Saccharomycodes ludwigii]
MSVCLGVTKTIAVTSLGIYTGMVTSGAIIAFATPWDILMCKLSKTLRKLSAIAVSFSTLSTIFFGLSYFYAPKTAQHPYLLYGLAVGPVSCVYSLALKVLFKCKKTCGSARTNVCPASGAVGGVCPVTAGRQDDGVLESCPAGFSTKDLEEGSAPDEKKIKEAVDKHLSIEKRLHELEPKLAKCHTSIALYLTSLAIISVAGLAQSVFGVYGEGLFI